MYIVVKMVWFIMFIYLLVIADKKNKSHYVYINDFNRFMSNKAKYNNEKHFCKHCLQCFDSENK